MKLRRNGGSKIVSITTQSRENTVRSDHYISLRDHFAGLSLAGLYASRDLQMATLHDAGGHGQGNFEDVMAKQAYRQADAMLRARGGDRD
jgi:hypothetical protein